MATTQKKQKLPLKADEKRESLTDINLYKQGGTFNTWETSEWDIRKETIYKNPVKEDSRWDRGEEMKTEEGEKQPQGVAK